MSEVVLDASALLALLNREPGHEEVARAVPRAAIGAINLSEVVAKLSESGMPEETIREALEGLVLEVHPFGRDLAYEAGLLRPITKPRGLSLGDRACLALGRHPSLPVFTTDRVWEGLEVGDFWLNGQLALDLYRAINDKKEIDEVDRIERVSY